MADHLTLSELNGLIQAALNSALGSRSFWIVADVTKHRYKGASKISVPAKILHSTPFRSE